MIPPEEMAETSVLYQSARAFWPRYGLFGRACRPGWPSDPGDTSGYLTGWGKPAAAGRRLGFRHDERSP